MLNNECKVYVRASGEGEEVRFRFDCGEGSRYVLWTLKQHQEKLQGKDTQKIGRTVPRDAELEIVRFGSRKFRETMAEMCGELNVLDAIMKVCPKGSSSVITIKSPNFLWEFLLQ